MNSGAEIANQTKTLASIFQKKNNGPIPRSRLPSKILGANSYQNRRRIKKPYGSFVQILVSDKKSLSSFVESLKEEIKKKVDENSEDSVLIANFSKKFSDLYIEWNELMNFMLDKIKELDKKYMSLDYFGFKEKLAHNLLNISLSFIIIDDETIKNKINLFFEILEPTMNQISCMTKRLLELDKNHSVLLTQNNNTISTIQAIKNNIKVLVKTVGQKHSIDKETLENDLLDMINKHEEIENKIMDVILDKKQCNERIRTEYHSLENCLQFDYFMHDDWCPYLDVDIIRKFKN